MKVIKFTELAIAIGIAASPGAIANAQIFKQMPQADVVECTVYPAVPDGLANYQEACRASREEDSIVLANGYLSVAISSESGVIVAVENKLTGERYPVASDRTGVSFTNAAENRIEWYASDGNFQDFEVRIDRNGDDACGVELMAKTEDGSATIVMTYSLAKDQFWVERRLSADSGQGKVNYDQLCYGRAEVPGGQVKPLKLGKFDSPRLVTAGEGGLFAGVGWWFYEVEDGLYQNTGMNYETEGRFDAEPWYLGVFKAEQGEPYSGWLWYRTFLQERKLAYDKQSSYSIWNARSGYDFRPISDPNILTFVDAATRIGLDGVSTGLASRIVEETERAATDPAARQVVDAFTDKGVEFGLHEGDVRGRHWESDEALAKKLKAIDDAWEQGIRNLTIDFFGVSDRFSDHRRATRFFRHVRERMSYSECHLGMAVYGPQFQREVLINHPTDLKGFDISRFSSDWATLVGFRQSRRRWQKTYEYLMPENGLYYFSTHYSNFPRRYEDPEPQQFLFRADAWRGLAYAFHDKIGFRDSLAAQAAFSTFYVFGFFDSGIPERDAAFARDYLAWVKANTDVLSRGRVSMETDDAMVMSKIRDGRGAIFALNYTPGRKHFKMKLALEEQVEAIDVRQIYPVRGETVRLRSGEILETGIPGERLAIFEVNDGLEGLPPENPSDFPIDITGWKPAGDGFQASFVIPDVRENLARQKDSTLPVRLVSADQTETEYVRSKQYGKSPGKLPREFLEAYGFEEEKFLPTWKAVPWAFADRVWLVYVPAVPPTFQELEAQKPTVDVNGSKISMAPRVQYDPKGGDPKEWVVPMWFADVTEVANYGGSNNIILSGINGDDPGACFVISSGWHEGVGE